MTIAVRDFNQVKADLSCINQTRYSTVHCRSRVYNVHASCGCTRFTTVYNLLTVGLRYAVIWTEFFVSEIGINSPSTLAIKQCLRLTMTVIYLLAEAVEPCREGGRSSDRVDRLSPELSRVDGPLKSRVNRSIESTKIACVSTRSISESTHS